MKFAAPPSPLAPPAQARSGSALGGEVEHWPQRAHPALGRKSPSTARARQCPTLLVALCLLTLSCSHFRKMKECRALAAGINPTLDRVATLHTKGASDFASWTQIQTQYVALANHLRATSTSDSELDRLRSEYVNIANSAAATAGNLADALRRDTNQPIYAARLRLKTLASEQSRITRRIAQHCRP